MEIIFGCDDGRKDMLKVAEMLEHFGLKGTFYIAPFERNCDLTVNDILRLAEKHRIGGHTLTHQRLTECTLKKAKLEIEMGKEELEDIIKKPLTTFATPRGWYNDNIIQMIKEAGFLEHRTIKMGITNREGYDNFHLPVSAHMYPRPEYQGISIKNAVIEKYNEAKIGGYFNLLMHTGELNRYSLWESLTDILKYISDDQNKNPKAD
jgi:peptidoglycan/xylan/chitin deacetylase (PgdA/CDA1 family)